VALASARRQGSTGVSRARRKDAPACQTCGR
jgi:hypothetical protein